MDNQQFTEDQRAEAYRVESMQQLMRQTKAVEETARYTYTLRALAIAWTIASVVLFLMAVTGAF